MKRYLSITSLILSFSLLITGTSLAQTKRTIRLKDGSVLRGKVIGMSNGTYTIKTGNLGTFQLPESKISSIEEAGARPSQAAQMREARNQQFQSTAQGTENGQLMQMPQRVQAFQRQATSITQNMPPQAKAMQQLLLSDPELMKDIQGLASDPQVIGVIGDPEMMKAIMDGDMEAVGNNPKAQSLMNNPKMKDFLQKFGKKMEGQK